MELFTLKSQIRTKSTRYLVMTKIWAAGNEPKMELGTHITIPRSGELQLTSSSSHTFASREEKAN